MAEYISREALLERIDDIWDCADMVFEPNDHCCRADDCASCKWSETKNAIRKIIANFPAADVRPVKRGRWELDSGPGEPWRYVCNICGEKTKDTVMGKPRANYCPNCGADMREEQDGR